MSTIQQVLRDVNDSTRPLDAVLRSAMVLAYELDYEPLIRWVNAELDGYENKEALPDYRKFGARIYANFLGPFHEVRNREVVPVSVFPEEWRETYSTVELMLGVRALEDVAGRDDVTQTLPDFILEYLTNNAAYGFLCRAAWLDIPPGSIAQILSAIRTRLVRFCLTLRREFPQLAEDDSSSSVVPIPPPTIAYYFNTIVMGQNASLALGGDIFNARIERVTPGDLESLMRSLAELGVEENDLETIRNATAEISREEIEKDPSRVERLRNLSASAARKVAGGIPADARSYVVEIILKMIATYYGINLP